MLLHFHLVTHLLFLTDKCTNTCMYYNSFTNSPHHPPTPSLTHSFAYLLTHPPTNYTLTHSLTSPHSRQIPVSECAVLIDSVPTRLYQLTLLWLLKYLFSTWTFPDLMPTDWTLCYKVLYVSKWKPYFLHWNLHRIFLEKYIPLYTMHKPILNKNNITLKVLKLNP